jgi:hypothetical protein
MADDALQDISIDWNAAAVDGGRLRVPLLGDPSGAWRDRLKHVIERLQRGGSGWGEIKVTKSALRVDAVRAGAEADLRHFLESGVLQANSDLRAEEEESQADEEEPADDRSESDQQMTEAFRSFSGDASERGADAT